MYEDLSTIVSSAVQMSNVITSIVEWTGVASAACDVGSLSSKPPRDLHGACMETVASMSRTASGGLHSWMLECLQVRVVVHKALPRMIRVDAGMFTQVVAIALSNALKVCKSILQCHAPETLGSIEISGVPVTTGSALK